MIKILLCCGGGFSSSALATKIKKEIIENNMQDDFYIEFSPFTLVENKLSEFDIIVCCPHLRFEVQKTIRALSPDKPFYVLPPRMYGLMSAKELSYDAMDAIDLYNKTKMNPVCFPGEENTLRISRHKSYRNSKI